MIIQTIVNIPLRKCFDYLLPNEIDSTSVKVGMRVKVPFSGKSRVAIVVGIADTSEFDQAKLKSIESLIDQAVLFRETDLQLLRWISQYYIQPFSDVIFSSMPPLLKKGHVYSKPVTHFYTLKQQDFKIDQRASKQLELVEIVTNSSVAVVEETLSIVGGNWRQALNALIKKGVLTKVTREDAELPVADNINKEIVYLNSEQQAVVDCVVNNGDGFKSYLLDGVTGSGKTEVYIELSKVVLKQNKQVLILVPEINLTPQFLKRFQARLAVNILVLHSGLSEKTRLESWMMATMNEQSVIIGTRSSILIPMYSLGMIIVDEEHDPSYKQQDRFKYNARDIAVKRAHLLNIPVILGSATPSMESFYNVEKNNYHYLMMNQRVGNAELPVIKLIDIKKRVLQGGVSTPLLKYIAQHLGREEQVLLFINRRGYSSVFLCGDCGWFAQCRHCDVRLTYHHYDQRLKCHCCGYQQQLVETCPDCGSSQLKMLGQGTEQIEEVLTKLFPKVDLIRIDRDSVRKKGMMEKCLELIHQKGAKILIGTQMLAKGHHFPNVTLVGVLQGDQGLFGVDFRSHERLAQLITQVSGRAGRAEKPGVVYIQSYTPEHIMWRDIVTHDYRAFARRTLLERLEVNMPPYSAQVLIRAESRMKVKSMNFLNQIKPFFQHQESVVEVLGPIPALVEKKIGKYHAQLLVQANQKKELNRVLNHWLGWMEQNTLDKSVRWVLDVDPMETV
ncbi:MAG: primosomal protein N' [Methylococcales bacterium]|jgi:primosomal protein N' (replication factor Y) (superfamily II helicase)|nr:primosomal protein N' [Methylococcales bacterium]